MKVAKNTVVALSYELEVEGKLADRANSEDPLAYIHGTGMLLPKFEEAVEGKEPGEKFAFTLSAEEGYGELHPEYIVDIPKSAFEQDGKVREDLLVVGNMIPMLNSDGNVVHGRIAEVLEEKVKMDFNHPMAGKVLNFSGKVESVRAATEKELAEGLHGEYLPKEGCHCGGNCGEGCECGDGCNCGEGCECGEGECHCNEGEECHCEGECKCEKQ